VKRSTNLCVPFMHLLLRGTGEVRSVILPYLQQAVDALGLTRGIFNVDIIVDRDKPYLIDISPRIGGNCIPDLYLRGWGVNEWHMLVDFHRGNNSFILPGERSRLYGVYIMHSERPGTMAQHTPMADPGSGIDEVYYAKEPGDPVCAFTEGSCHVGYVIFSSETDDALKALASRVAAHRWFGLETWHQGDFPPESSP